MGNLPILGGLTDSGVKLCYNNGVGGCGGKTGPGIGTGNG